MSASVKITQRFKLPEEILARLKAKQLDTARVRSRSGPSPFRVFRAIVSQRFRLAGPQSIF